MLLLCRDWTSLREVLKNFEELIGSAALESPANTLLS